MIFIIWSFAQSQAQSKFWHLEKQWLSQIHDILILKPSPIYNSKYRYTGTKIDIFLCHLWTGKSFSTIIHIISSHRKGAVAFLSYYIFFPLPAFYVPMKILFIFCLFMVRLRDVTFFDGFFPLKLHKWGNLSFAADNHSAPWSATVGQKGSNMWNKNCTLEKRLIIIRLTFFAK